MEHLKTTFAHPSRPKMENDDVEILGGVFETAEQTNKKKKREK